MEFCFFLRNIIIDLIIIDNSNRKKIETISWGIVRIAFHISFSSFYYRSCCYVTFCNSILETQKIDFVYK